MTRGYVKDGSIFMPIDVPFAGAVDTGVLGINSRGEGHDPAPVGRPEGRDAAPVATRVFCASTSPWSRSIALMVFSWSHHSG
jgi:hypothetical protein